MRLHDSLKKLLLEKLNTELAQIGNAQIYNFDVGRFGYNFSKPHHFLDFYFFYDTNHDCLQIEYSETNNIINDVAIFVTIEKEDIDIGLFDVLRKLGMADIKEFNLKKMKINEDALLNKNEYIYKDYNFFHLRSLLAVISADIDIFLLQNEEQTEGLDKIFTASELREQLLKTGINIKKLFVDSGIGFDKLHLYIKPDNE